jgi:arabinofuranosyltransferase
MGRAKTRNRPARVTGGKSPSAIPAATGKFHPQSAMRFVAAGLLAAVVIYVAHSLYYWAYVNDDAYITFRYSRFLAMGRGPYYNLAEHVEGYTNFLLMLLITPIISIFGESGAAPFAKGLDIACGALAMMAVGALVWRVDRAANDSPWRSAVAAVMAAALVAIAPGYSLNSTSGLETMLLAGEIALGLLLGHLSMESGRWRGAGIAFACAALTRPEGILFFAIYWVAQLFGYWQVSKTRPALRTDVSPTIRNPKSAIRNHLFDALIVAVVFIGHLVFRLIAYDGEWLPNTYYAKAGGFWKVAAASYIGHGALKPFFDMYGIGVGVGIIGWLLSGATRRVSLPLFCVAAGGALLPFVTGTDWMLGWRLFMPFLPALGGIVAIGWCRVATLLVRQPRWLGPALVPLAIPLLWYLHAHNRQGFYDYVQMRARGYDTGHTTLAEWLRSGAARKGDTIALMDIGIVGYLCIDQNILDITGLTDRTIAKSSGEFMRKEYDPTYVFGRKPEYIVVVFGANGNPDVPPPPGTRLRPWSENERAIANHPEFLSRYVHRRTAPAKPAHWTETIAAQLGAERIFEHAHPGKYYLLAAFKRSE